MSRIFVFLMALLGATAAVADEHFSGFYLGSARTWNTGEFSVGLSTEAGTFEVLRFSASGRTRSLCAGYRHQFGDARLTFGGELCGEFGIVKGSQRFSRIVDGQLATLAFRLRSNRKYTARLSFGYQPAWASRWLGEVSYGLSAAAAELHTTGTYVSYRFEEAIDGWMMGETFGVRLTRQMFHHSSISLSYDVVDFRYSKTRQFGFDGVSLHAHERTERVTFLWTTQF